MSNDCHYGPYYRRFFCYWYGYMNVYDEYIVFLFSIVVYIYSILGSYYIVSYWCGYFYRRG